MAAIKRQSRRAESRSGRNPRRLHCRSEKPTAQSEKPSQPNAQGQPFIYPSDSCARTSVSVPIPLDCAAPLCHAATVPIRDTLPNRLGGRPFRDQNALRPRRRLRKAAPRRRTQGRFAATGRVRRPKPSRAAVSAMTQRARSKAASSPPVIQNKHHSAPYSIGVKTFRQARSKRQARRRICRKRQMRFCLV